MASPPPSPTDPPPGSPQERKPRWRAVLRHGARAVAGIAIGLLITEAAFHVRDHGAFPHVNFYTADADRGVRLRAGATEKIRFSRNPITSVRTNSEGYRGAEWPAPSADEIITVGDSQVFGLGVEEGETFSAVLQSSLGDGRVVRNLGVPTYGPLEYNAVLEEALTKRKASVVVYTVNVANDLFEAKRPNRERHAVWDGWAVRKETAPSSVTWFPGRSFLYGRSHAFYAFRRWMYDRGPKLDEGGFASEGTWRDIGEAGAVADREHSAAEDESARVAKRRQSELESATASAAELETAVTRQAEDDPADPMNKYVANPRGLDNEALLRAARLSPGDIVMTSDGEEARSVHVTAQEIQRGAALRIAVAKYQRARAERQKELMARRDELKKKVAELEAAPLPKIEVDSPVTPAMRAAKAICDAHGARLVVVALPIDVQVSSAEWAKYGAKPLDMEPSKILLEDIVASARALGAEGLDATPALVAAEPGAFLDGDIHMTPKGHRALGEAVARVLRGPRASAREN